MFVRGHLNVFGESIGFFDGDDLVAYLALTTDLVASGEDVEFEACTPTSNDVVFAAAMVLPSHQGRSLHRAGILSHIAVADNSVHIAASPRSRRATTGRCGTTSPRLSVHAGGHLSGWTSPACCSNAI